MSIYIQFMSHKKHCCLHYERHQFILFTERIGVYCYYRTKHINALCARNSEPLNFAAYASGC
jgi:hypothetical protein